MARVSGSSKESSSGTDSEDPWLWVGVLVAVFGAMAWLDRNAWLAALAPYGLTSEDTRTTGGRGNSQWGPVSENHYGTGIFHINVFGWFALAIVVAGLVAALWCVLAVMNVLRWRAAHGTTAIPKIPVPALAVVAAAMTFVMFIALFGRHSGRTWLMIVAVVGTALAAVAFFAVMIFAMMPAYYWRQIQAFAGLADQVLGHGHPSAGRVRALGWQVAITDNRERRWPTQLVAVTGPGWQHKPAELDELNRYARKFGWPPYEWRYDPMAKRITGTARLDAEIY